MPRAKTTPKRSTATPRPATPRKRAASSRKSTTVIEHRAATLLDAYPWGQFSNTRISPEVAVKVSSIFAVCRFISQAVGVMVPRLNLRDGRRIISSNLPCSRALRRRPNPWQSPFDFWTLQAFWTALHGRGFARILPGAYGWMTHLIPVHPCRMLKIEQLDDYSLQYQYLDDDNRVVKARGEEMLHFRWMSGNGIDGMAPTEVCSTSITLARELDKAALAYWRNGARPDFLIKLGQKLDDATIERYRREFKELYGGENRGAPGMMRPGDEFIPFPSNTMEQAQFAKLRESILPEICQHWGVPASLVGDQKAVRYGNPEQENLNAHIWCLLPWQKRMAGAVDLVVQDVHGEDVFFSLDNRGLLRGDTVARTSLYRALMSMGAITPNEIRQLEDFDLLDSEAADATFMQLGFGTLDNVSKGVANGATAVAAPGSEDPVDPAADPMAAGPDLAATALNGAQVTALLEVLAQVSAGLLDKPSAVAVILSSFPTITEAEANKIVDGAKPAPLIEPPQEPPADQGGDNAN